MTYQPRSQRAFELPTVPDEIEDPKAREYLKTFQETMVRLMDGVVDDLHEGRERKTILSTAPSASDFDEGQSILANVSGNFRLYYRNNDGTVKFVTIDDFDQDDLVIPSAVPPGVTTEFAGSSAPSGWLMCDGSAVSQTTYAALYAVIGTTYGAPGGGNFNLPDCRGSFPFGKSTSGTGSTLGGTFGSIDHSHTVDAHTHTMAHTHSVPRDGWGHSATNPDPAGRILTGEGTANVAEEAANDNTTGAASTSTTSSDGNGTSGTSNPPALVFNYIIKT